MKFWICRSKQEWHFLLETGSLEVFSKESRRTSSIAVFKNTRGCFGHPDMDHFTSPGADLHGSEHLNPDSTMFSNPSTPTIRLWLHWAAHQMAFALCKHSARKGLKNTSVVPYPLNFILHILTHASAYISHRRLPLPRCRAICQTCTPLESRSELCYPFSKCTESRPVGRWQQGGLCTPGSDSRTSVILSGNHKSSDQLSR